MNEIHVTGVSSGVRGEMESSNKKFAALAAPGMVEAKAAFKAAGEKLRRFADIRYGAATATGPRHGTGSTGWSPGSSTPPPLRGH